MNWLKRVAPVLFHTVDGTVKMRSMAELERDTGNIGEQLFWVFFDENSNPFKGLGLNKQVHMSMFETNGK